MNLQQFLKLETTSADNTTALAEAQTFELVEKKLIHRDSMNSYLAQLSIYRAFQILADTDGDPWQDAAAAFMDSQEFNFMTGDGTTTGDLQIVMLDDMIAGNVTVDVGGNTVDVSAALAQLKPIVLARANLVTYPFADVTLEDIAYYREEVIELGKQLSESMFTLTIANDARTPQNDVVIQQRYGNDENNLTPWRTLANFPTVEFALDTYQALIPPTPRTHREIRIVSPVTLGMSIS